MEAYGGDVQELGHAGRGEVCEAAWGWDPSGQREIEATAERPWHHDEHAEVHAILG